MRKSWRPGQKGGLSIGQLWDCPLVSKLVYVWQKVDLKTTEIALISGNY